MRNHQPRGEETRAHILQAALDCFAREGYDATGIAEICKRAGVSKGAFYHHFPSKHDLFMQLMEIWLARLDLGLQAAQASGPDVPQALVNMAGLMRNVLAEADNRVSIFLEFWTEALHDPAVWRETVAPYRRYRAFFAQRVEAGIAEGTLRPVDPELAAQARVSQEAMQLLLAGLARNSSARQDAAATGG
jgi:AcrR family transcriptional regulator